MKRPFVLTHTILSYSGVVFQQSGAGDIFLVERLLCCDANLNAKIPSAILIDNLCHGTRLPLGKTANSNYPDSICILLFAVRSKLQMKGQFYKTCSIFYALITNKLSRSTSSRAINRMDAAYAAKQLKHLCSAIKLFRKLSFALALVISLFLKPDTKCFILY